MIDFELRRLTMVETQIRPNEVTETRLLAALRALPRELFVPPELRPVAYMDEGIQVFPAIDSAPPRFLLAPMVLARLVQLAAVEHNDTVLDVGCATGYSTAVLASLGREVIGLEPEPELAASAREALRQTGIANASIVEGPLELGHREAGPYDVIVLNGTVPALPEHLAAQLKEGGRLAAILSAGGLGSQGKAYLFIKAGGKVSGVPHFDAGARPLTGFVPERCFSLYIAGEEMSWGQHIFQWNTPEYWATVNRQEETNLHNTWAIFEKTPRSLLEIGIFLGGIVIPIAAVFYPWLRACRVSLFLPPGALMPTALGMVIFKLIDRLQQGQLIPTVLQRPSETIETYLYFFILAYLIVYARRIKQLEVAEGALPK